MRSRVIGEKEHSTKLVAGIRPPRVGSTVSCSDDVQYLRRPYTLCCGTTHALRVFAAARSSRVAVERRRPVRALEENP